MGAPPPFLPPPRPAESKCKETGCARSVVEMTSTEERIRVLESFPLDDSSTSVQGPTLSLSVDTNYNFFYRDSNGYESRWVEETKQLTETVRWLSSRAVQTPSYFIP